MCILFEKKILCIRFLIFFLMHVFFLTRFYLLNNLALMKRWWRCGLDVPRSSLLASNLNLEWDGITDTVDIHVVSCRRYGGGGELAARRKLAHGGSGDVVCPADSGTQTSDHTIGERAGRSRGSLVQRSHWNQTWMAEFYIAWKNGNCTWHQLLGLLLLKITTLDFFST